MTTPTTPSDPTPPDAAAAVERAVAELGGIARADHPLGPYSTYRVGGPASVFVTVESDADLEALGRAVRASGLPVLAVGKGSNLLVADAGFPGIAFTLGDAFASVDILDAPGPGADPGPEGRVIVRAGAAASLPVVARRTAAAGLTGFEWAVGVPGSVGGAVRMNAGGHGSDMAATVTRVRVVDLRGGEDGVVPASALQLGYRRSAIASDHLVVWAELALAVGSRTEAEAEIAEIVRWRRANQPGGANAGSVFTNPPHDSAGRLIDSAGGKGLRVGTASVSTKHANFIQADDGGSADDVFELMAAVRRLVRAEHAVDLHPETVLVGFPTAPGEGP